MNLHYEKILRKDSEALGKDFFGSFLVAYLDPGSW